MWRCVDPGLTDVSEERISIFRVKIRVIVSRWLQTESPVGSNQLYKNRERGRVGHMDFSTLKMEAIRSSETTVNTGPTQRRIPEDDILLAEIRLYC
jgi:hypothetical protein